MTDTFYNLRPGSVAGALDSLASQGTKNAILQALRANGLLGPSREPVGVDVIPAAPYTTVADGGRDQVTILGPDTNTLIASASPTIVALTSGRNFVTLANGRSPGLLPQAETVIGGSGRDTIVGNAAADLLRAGSGRELLISRGGVDTLSGGSGRDTLIGGGRSSVVGGSGHATIAAGVGSASFAGIPHDTIQAGSGQDSITLTYGANTVYAPQNGGSATVNAGAGSDTIYGPEAFQGAETINSASGGHTTFHLASGAVTYNLSSESADTVFGGRGGFLNLNKATTDITSATSTTVSGQSAVVYTFAGGGSVTAVGSVNITFTNTRHGG